MCVCISLPVVCVGGCGGGALHSAGSAPDSAALQAGREDCQERLPVSEEALPQRARVSTLQHFRQVFLKTVLYKYTHSVYLV